MSKFFTLGVPSGCLYIQIFGVPVLLSIWTSKQEIKLFSVLTKIPIIFHTRFVLILNIKMTFKQQYNMLLC